MTEIKWQFTAAVAGGPSVSLNQPPMNVDAYDVVQKVIQDGASGTLLIQPPSSESEMVMVVISSDQYGPKLTYKGGLGTDNKVDGPHIFLGSGAASFLGSTPPTSLSFTNNLGKAATISVLVARTVS